MRIAHLEHCHIFFPSNYQLISRIDRMRAFGTDILRLGAHSSAEISGQYLMEEPSSVPNWWLS